MKFRLEQKYAPLKKHLHNINMIRASEVRTQRFVICYSVLHQYLMKYGKIIKTIPIKTRKYRLATKYENTINPIPENSATVCSCFFPYIKYPKPIELNNASRIIDTLLYIESFRILFSYCSDRMNS